MTARVRTAAALTFILILAAITVQAGRSLAAA